MVNIPQVSCEDSVSNGIVELLSNSNRQIRFTFKKKSQGLYMLQKLRCLARAVKWVSVTDACLAFGIEPWCLSVYSSGFDGWCEDTILELSLEQDSSYKEWYIAFPPVKELPDVL